MDILDTISDAVQTRNAQTASLTTDLVTRDEMIAVLRAAIGVQDVEIARLTDLLANQPPPAPEPEGTDEDGGPLFTPPPGFENGTTGNYWNLELTGDITERLQNMLDAGAPVFLGRSEGRTVTCKGVVTRKGYQIRGSGMPKCVIKMTEAKPFISNPADTETTGCYAGDFKIYGMGSAPIFDHYGFSNGTTHERIDYRGGGYALDLKPSPADGSAAFKGTIMAPFAFNQTQGFLRVRAGNGVSRTLCHLTIVNADIGRCNGPVLQFNDLRAESSAILIWHGLFDLAQGGLAAPNAVKFVNCQDMPLVWHTGKVTQGVGKDIVIADTSINVVLSAVQMREDPRPAYQDFPRFAIKTPTISVPGDQNNGVISYP